MVNRVLLSAALLCALLPAVASACACGCGLFDVQTSSLFPTGEGGTVFTEYDFVNQNRNWSGTKSAPSSDNDDKQIRTHFITVGGQYMFNRSWGMAAQVPLWDRHFVTEESGDRETFNHTSLGDIRISGVYAGFSDDMATGITFGVKLPTGDYDTAGFDRDTAIGTGSTDLLLGAYHMGKLNTSGSWDWFANAQVDQPVLLTGGFRPGSELSTALGVYYNQWSVAGVKVAPIAQVLGSVHLRNRGPLADPDNSGYRQVFFAPGIEIDNADWRLYADIALPVYQSVNGNQLVAGELFKVSISRRF